MLTLSPTSLGGEALSNHASELASLILHGATPSKEAVSAARRASTTRCSAQAQVVMLKRSTWLHDQSMSARFVLWPCANHHQL
jgi:hypothetical protein